MKTWINFAVVGSLIASLVLFLTPVVDSTIKIGEARKVVNTFKSIDFALNLFFYTEGFEMTKPNMVNVSTLVRRYYLKSDPGGYYGIFWKDPNVSDDGKVVAVVYYTGKVDPVAMKRVLKNVVWFDLRKRKEGIDYSEGSYPAFIVEVIRTW